MDLLSTYLIIINAISFLFMLADKEKARKNRWRIPERTLLAAAILGGSLGGFLGMRLCRHKTRNPKFAIGLPCLFALHTLLVYFHYICQLKERHG